MRDFAAIDFETANECPSSVCSVGVVIVRGGEVTDSFYSLIHPEPEYYKVSPIPGAPNSTGTSLYRRPALPRLKQLKENRKIEVSFVFFMFKECILEPPAGMLVAG